MAGIARNLTELIGNTPMLELANYCRAEGLDARLIANLSILIREAALGPPQVWL